MDFKLQVLSSAPRAMSRNIRRGLQGRASNLNLIALRSRALYVAHHQWAHAGPFFKGRGVPFEAPPLSHTPFLALLLTASQQASDASPSPTLLLRIKSANSTIFVLKNTYSHIKSHPPPLYWLLWYVPTSLLSERVSPLSLNLFHVTKKEGVRRKSKKLSNRSREVPTFHFSFAPSYMILTHT